jgi:hypothetical protein
MSNPVRGALPIGDTGSATMVVPVTPSDVTGFKTCRALLVGTAGAATLVDASGETRTAVPLQAGYNPISVQRINSTSLTAANIWALY